MQVVFIVSLIALLFAILDSTGRQRSGLKIAFVIITVLSCLRYNFGNDYPSYMKEFLEMGNYSVSSILFHDTFKDKLWFILQHFLRPIGWVPFVGAISIFSNVAYYKLIKEYVPRKFYWLGFFIYVFTFDMFVLQQSMIRQGLVVAIMALVFMRVDKMKTFNLGQFLLVLLGTACALGIHKSSVVCVPCLLIKFLPLRKRFIPLILALVFVALFFLQDSIAQLVINILFSDELSNYASDYLEEEGRGIGVRAILEFIPFFVAAWYLWQKDTADGPRFLIVLSMIATMLYPVTMLNHLMSRLTYYFSILSMATIPVTYDRIKNKLLRNALLFLMMAIQMYVYFDRFANPTYKQAFGVFHTIFSM